MFTYCQRIQKDNSLAPTEFKLVSSCIGDERSSTHWCAVSEPSLGNSPGGLHIATSLMFSRVEEVGSGMLELALPSKPLLHSCVSTSPMFSFSLPWQPVREANWSQIPENFSLLACLIYADVKAGYLVRLISNSRFEIFKVFLLCVTSERSCVR